MVHHWWTNASSMVNKWWINVCGAINREQGNNQLSPWRILRKHPTFWSYSCEQTPQVKHTAAKNRSPAYLSMDVKSSLFSTFGTCAKWGAVPRSRNKWSLNWQRGNYQSHWKIQTYETVQGTALHGHAAGCFSRLTSKVCAVEPTVEIYSKPRMIWVPKYWLTQEKTLVTALSLT